MDADGENIERADIASGFAALVDDLFSRFSFNQANASVASVFDIELIAYGEIQPDKVLVGQPDESVLFNFYDFGKPVHISKLSLAL